MLQRPLIQRALTPKPPRLALIYIQIVPLITFFLLLCFIDRSLQAYAWLEQDFQTRLNLTDFSYGLSSGLFYVTYALSKFPFTPLFHKSGRPVTWLAAMLIGWSLLTIASALIRGYGLYLSVRLLLGVFSAGAMPGALLYVSYFVPNQNITLPLSIIETSSNFAHVLAGPLAMLVTFLNGVWGFGGSQWLFLICGFPGLIIAGCMLLFLPNNIQQLRWLSSYQKDALEFDITSQNRAKASPHTHSNMSFIARLKQTLTNWRLCLIILAVLVRNMTFGGLMYWLPMFVKRILTQGEVQVQSEQENVHLNSRVLLLTTLMWAISTVAYVINGWIATKSNRRARYLSIPFIASGACLFTLPMVPVASTWFPIMLLLGGLVLNTAGQAPASSLMLKYTDQSSKDVGCACYSAIPQIGNVLGPLLIGWAADSSFGSVGVVSVYGALLAVVGLCAALVDREYDDEFGAGYRKQQDMGGSQVSWQFWPEGLSVEDSEVQLSEAAVVMERVD